MRRLGVFVSLLAILALASPGWSQEACQYAHVVDPCGKRVIILPTGDANTSYVVDLSGGPAGAYEPRGVAHATVPGWQAYNAFVTQGPYLHVVDYELYYTDKDITPVRTMSLVDDLGWSPVQLTGIAAAGAIEVNGVTYYPLYVTGFVDGAVPTPWLMIFDQAAVLEGPLMLSKVLLGAVVFDDDGGTAIDVAVGPTLDGGHRQEAFASVLSGMGVDVVQQFYRIFVEDGVGFGVSLEPWNDEGQTFAGGEPQSIGLDYESLGLDAYGVFQTSSVVSDLHSGAPSCVLGPGALTDVAVWGPDAELEHSYVHFATASNGVGWVGILLGYPQGVCPYDDPPSVTPGAVVQSIGSRPLAVALSSDTGNPFWLYTANASGGVTTLRIHVYDDSVNGDTVDVTGQVDLALGGCPSAITFRGESIAECMHPGSGDPPGPRPDDFCDLYPTDPWCLKKLEPNE